MHICGDSFTDNAHLEEHISLHHETEVNTECDYCGMAYNTEHLLQLHIEQNHITIEDCEDPDQAWSPQAPSDVSPEVSSAPLLWLDLNILSFNIEGYQRNKHYLSQLIKDFSSQILLLQELWIPSGEICNLENDIPKMNFHVSTPDMFLHNEDKLGMARSGMVQLLHGMTISMAEQLPLRVITTDTVL